MPWAAHSSCYSVRLLWSRYAPVSSSFQVPSAPAMGLNGFGLRVAQETAALHERLDRAKVEQGRAEREVVRLTRELAVAGRGAA